MKEIIRKKTTKISFNFVVCASSVNARDTVEFGELKRFIKNCN